MDKVNITITGGGSSSGGSTESTVYTAPVEIYQEPETFVSPTRTPSVIYIPTKTPTRIPTKIPTAIPTRILTPTLGMNGVQAQLGANVILLLGARVKAKMRRLIFTIGNIHNACTMKD
jgi:hypothetical protein